MASDHATIRAAGDRARRDSRALRAYSAWLSATTRRMSSANAPEPALRTPPSPANSGQTGDSADHGVSVTTYARAGHGAMLDAMLMADTTLIKLRLGRNIALARSQQDPHVSQERLAAMIGVDRRRIIRWEKAQRRPSDTAIVAIAEALERPVAWFYEEHNGA